MSRFFIARPIFAWVIAIIIMLIGIVSVTRLPISRYPNFAPPSVQIDAVYPGASAKSVEDSVTQIIEQNMSGLDGLNYISSSSEHNGVVSISLTFASGMDPDTAQVQVQNKLQQATPLLPQIVQQQGITVRKAAGAYQLIVAFVSEDGSLESGDIGDYLASTVIDPLSRVPGVGSVELFGSKYAMRIWLDADKLRAYALTPADITAAVRAQNAQLSIGQLGDLPSVPGQQLNATITALGRFQTPEQFRDVILRSKSDGSMLRLGDVARIEMGLADYNTALARYNGKPAAGLGIRPASGANALQMADQIEALLEKLRPQLPRGLKAINAFDSTPFIRESIKEVGKTLAEAIVLVFLVMLLFLQNLRATLIPTIAVPVVLLGTFCVLAIAGFSINMLTMFAVVLAIGLLVDDAIVVVENVERLMQEEGLSPVEATRRSMDQVSGALVGIATVLSAVFVPMAFLQGAIGVIYRQFAVTIVTAMVLSVLTAIVLIPALCATLLKPHRKGQQPGHRFFSWFNRRFDSASRRYQGIVAHMLRRPVRYVLVYAALAVVMGTLFFRLPSAFLPDEDRGYLFTLVEAPVGATQTRTIDAISRTERYFLDHEQEAISSIFTTPGFSFSGSGQNAGFGFVELKNWSERKSPQLSARALQRRANAALSQIKDAQVFAIAPAPAVELGNVSGFDFYLKDNDGQGHAALTAARDQFLALANKSKLLANVRAAGSDDAPLLRLDIDSQKAASFGLAMSEVNDILEVAWAGRYINDFVDRGRLKRVIMQGDAPFRMVPENFGRWHVRNGEGAMVSVASFAKSHWEYAAPRLERYNGFSAMQINGEAAPGVSSGAAMDEIEKLVTQLPPGFAADFTGQSYEERAVGAQAPMLYAMSLIVVFLCLAALYESWSIPTVILLAAPLGVIGAVVATTLRGLERDVYFQVAMLTTVGLTSKNAILIVEFAKVNVDRGMSLVDATVRAVRDRVRPILMTSLAFGIGVLPLVVAMGAGAGAQRAVGTGVFGGMLAGTFLSILFIPLFFVVVWRLFYGRSRKQAVGSNSSPVAEGSMVHGA